MNMHYSYKILKEIISQEVTSYHDGMIEAGIGNNFSCYRYFRKYGYDKCYIGMNLEQPNVQIPKGLIIIEKDCFEPYVLSDIFQRYNLTNPIFLTNNALTDCLLIGKYA